MNNLRILNELLIDKAEKVFHKEYLKGKGFNFGVCTHCMVMDNQNRFCYYQYVLINGVNDTVKIIKNNGWRYYYWTEFFTKANGGIDWKQSLIDWQEQAIKILRDSSSRNNDIGNGIHTIK